MKAHYRGWSCKATSCTFFLRIVLVERQINDRVDRASHNPQPVAKGKRIAPLGEKGELLRVEVVDRGDPVDAHYERSLHRKRHLTPARLRLMRIADDCVLKALSLCFKAKRSPTFLRSKMMSSP